MDGARLLRYSIHRHTADMPRVRIVMPLSREVSGDEYRALSRAFVVSLARCLSLMNVLINLINFMFLPSVLWVLLVGLWGARWCVDAEKYLSLGGVASDEFSVLEDDDEEDFTRDLPSNMHDEARLLLAYGAGGLEYDDWLKSRAALHHQYQG